MSDPAQEQPSTVPPPEPSATPAEEEAKARHFMEFEQNRNLHQRLQFLAERFPGHYARLNVLYTLRQLQEARGGEFPEKIAFVHMPDFILNVRRIGKLDPDTLTAGLEVYAYNDIRPGIVWIPVEQVMWAGTTDIPYGIERVSLEAQPDLGPLHGEDQYERMRRILAGLAKPPETAD